MPCTFKDADKKANDLFKRNFVSGQVVKTSVKTATGVKFTTESSRKSGDSFATKLAAKFSHKASGFSVDKFEVNSTGGKKGPTMTSEVSLKDPSVPNTKFSLKTIIANSKDWEQEMAEIGAEYSDKMWCAAVKADPVNWTGSANFTATAEGFLFGVEGTVKADKATEETKFNYGVSALFGFHADDFQAIARCSTNKKGARVVDVSAHHQYSKALEVSTILSANCDYLLAESSAAAKQVSFKAGGKYNFDRDSSLAAHLGGDASLKLCYAQKLFPSVKVSACTTANLATCAGKGSMTASTLAQFGLQVELGDL